MKTGDGSDTAVPHDGLGRGLRFSSSEKSPTPSLAPATEPYRVSTSLDGSTPSPVSRSAVRYLRCNVRGSCAVGHNLADSRTRLRKEAPFECLQDSSVRLRRAPLGTSHPQGIHDISTNGRSSAAKADCWGFKSLYVNQTCLAPRMPLTSAGLQTVGPSPPFHGGAQAQTRFAPRS